MLPNILEPEISDGAEDINMRIRFGVDYAKSARIVKDNDHVVVVAGTKTQTGSTNTVRIVEVTPTMDGL